MFCVNCGKSLEDDAVFCGNCGTKVKKEAPAQPGVVGPVGEQPAVLDAQQQAAASVSAFGAPAQAPAAPPPAPPVAEEVAQPAAAPAEPQPASLPQPATAFGGAPAMPPAAQPAAAAPGTAVGVANGKLKGKSPVVLIAVAAVVVLIIGVLVYQNTGNRVFTKLLNEHATAVEKIDAQKMLDISAEVALMGDIYDELFAAAGYDYLTEMQSDLMYEHYYYGTGLTVDHQLLQVEKCDPLELEWLYYGISYAVEDAAELIVRTTVRGSDDWDVTQQAIYAVKISGKWYLFVSDIL